MPTDSITWTPDILKQYVDQRFLDSDKAVSAALQAAKEAVAKAEVATDKRFDSLSEEADRRALSLSAQISTLQAAMHEDQGGKNTAQRAWSMLLPTIISLVMIAVTLIIAFKP